MIFILGGRGFVGSAFTRFCEATGREYAVIDRQNYQSFVGRSCDILINANGNSKKYLAREAPLQEFDASVRSVRASLVDFRANYYVYFSSCDVYPDCSSPETTSEDVELNVAWQSPYGFHKYLAEQCVQHAARSWLIVRFGGFVGPGLKKNPIFDILQGGPLWLDPESELQYMHTDRAAEIVFSLIDRRLNREVINVCGKGLIKLQEVIDKVGRNVSVSPGSPKVRYDVNIGKLSRFVSVPDSRSAVMQFIEEMVQLGTGEEK